MFKELKGNYKIPILREAIDKLFRVIIEYRDSIPRDLVVNAILFSGDDLGKVNRSIK